MTPSKWIFAFLAMLLLVIPACRSTPTEDGEAERAASNAIRSRGGDASSEAKAGDFNVPVAGSYMGDAVNRNVAAKAERVTSNSAAFNQKAFDLAGNTTATAAGLATLREADFILSALRDEYARAVASPDSTAEERDAILAKMAARDEKIAKDFKSSNGGDLSGLGSLTVINTANGSGNSGHETKSLTDEEARQAGATLPAVVREAAKADDG